jgi:hypothetical protein
VQEGIRERRLRSARMPIALYYKGILNEYRPDLRRFEQDDVLTFYGDYVDERALGVWNRLYRIADYNDSAESIEARWRVARQMAGQAGLDATQLAGAMDAADRVLTEAGRMIEDEIARQENIRPATESLFGAFRPPPRTAMTAVKLRELRRRIRELQTLIGPPNREGGEGAVQRLAWFVMLDPHDPAYEKQLATLLERTGEKDGLRDNLLLAQAKLTPDEQRRGDRLAEVNRDFPQTDGGQQALYELTRLKIQRYQAQPDKANRDAAIDMLILFKDSYPGHFNIEQVQENLDALQASTP